MFQIHHPARAWAPFPAILTALFAALALLGVPAARAQTGGNFSLTWSSIDGGGAASAGGAFALIGAAGQPDAGQASGSPWSLTGGLYSAGFITTAVPPLSEGGPRVFHVYPAEPNPMVHGTSFAIDLPIGADVAARVFNVAGRRVRTLHDGWAPAGRLLIHWDATADDGSNLNAGVYFVKVTTPQDLGTAKVVLMREGGIR
jgi:hypothetical protein